MASCDNILKMTNCNGRVVYFLGYHSAYTVNMARILNGLLNLDDFAEETPEEILEMAGVDGMEFVPCENPEEIKPGEETVIVDYGKRIATLPPMEVSEIEEFQENYGAKIVEVDGEQCVDYGDGPEPLPLWPEEYKPLLDAKKADFETLLPFCEFIEEEACGMDFLCDGKIVHCEEM